MCRCSVCWMCRKQWGTIFQVPGSNCFYKLTWTINTSLPLKKAQQRLVFLRKLSQAKHRNSGARWKLSWWFAPLCGRYASCTATERSYLNRVVKVAQHIGAPEHHLCQQRASSIVRQHTSQPLPVWQRFQDNKILNKQTEKELLYQSCGLYHTLLIEQLKNEHTAVKLTRAQRGYLLPLLYVYYFSTDNLPKDA